MKASPSLGKDRWQTAWLLPAAPSSSPCRLSPAESSWCCSKNTALCCTAPYSGGALETREHPEHGLLSFGHTAATCSLPHRLRLHSHNSMTSYPSPLSFIPRIILSPSPPPKLHKAPGLCVHPWEVLLLPPCVTANMSSYQPSYHLFITLSLHSVMIKH